MPRGKGAPQPPARVKRNSQVEVRNGIMLLPGSINWPVVAYEALAVCPSKQAISIMGLKLTWYIEYATSNRVVPGRIYGNMGLIRFSDAEVEELDPADQSGIHNGFQKHDQRLARRVFGKQTTVLAYAGDSSGTEKHGPEFAAIVQAKNKGIITLTAGQGLYVAGFLLGDTATLRAINFMAEWSQTGRTSEAFTPA